MNTATKHRIALYSACFLLSVRGCYVESENEKKLSQISDLSKKLTEFEKFQKENFHDVYAKLESSKDESSKNTKQIKAIWELLALIPKFGSFIGLVDCETWQNGVRACFIMPASKEK